MMQSGAPSGPRLDAQAEQYRNSSPDVLLRQLNELGTSVRTRDRAVADRDRVIHELHGSVAARDKAIKQLTDRLRYAKIRVALLYALIGGAAAKGVEALVVALAHFFVAWLRHHS
jgi:hypothetical protein